MTLSKRYPPRGPSPFRQATMVKAVRSAEAAGLEVGAVEITKDGTIRVVTRSATDQNTAPNPWDQDHAENKKRAS